MFTYLKQADNLIPSATLTPTSEDADYPIENVQAEPVHETYRTEGATSQKILIDFDEPVTADLFAVCNHNLTDQATITLRGGSSQDPDGGSFELVIPWSRRNAWELFDAETWQYWSLTLDDSGNPDGVLESGLWAMGEATELLRDFSLGSAQQRETVNQALESEYGVITAGPNLYQRTRFVASWKTTSDAERYALREFLLRLEKERGGLFFIPDTEDDAAYFGRLVSDHSEVRRYRNITDFNGLAFLEDSVGKSLFS
jgi:hypothetical protein